MLRLLSRRLAPASRAARALGAFSFGSRGVSPNPSRRRREVSSTDVPCLRPEGRRLSLSDNEAALMLAWVNLPTNLHPDGAIGFMLVSLPELGKCPTKLDLAFVSPFETI